MFLILKTFYSVSNNDWFSFGWFTDYEGLKFYDFYWGKMLEWMKIHGIIDIKDMK